MRGFYVILPLLFIFAGCKPEHNAESIPPVPYPQPEIVPLATNSLYTVNPVTGNRIEPVVVSGDTIPTGIPISATGKKIHQSNLEPPEVRRLGKPRIVALRNKKPVSPDSVFIHEILEDSIVSVPLDTAKADAYLINTRGDTIPTGTPIEIRSTVVSCLQPQPVPAQSPSVKDQAVGDFRYMDVQHGLSTSYIRGIAEDKYGNIWVANNETGVSCFNGEYILHYTTEQGLAHNQIRSVFADKNGHLWFGALNGSITRFDGAAFVRYSVTDGLSGYTVWSILQDNNGVIWFGTGGGGVTAFDGEAFTHFTENEGLPGDDIRTILEDRHGNLWFGTFGGGITKFNGSTFTTYSTKTVLLTDYYLSSHEDSDGNLWFGTDGGGVSKYDGNTFTHYTSSSGISSHQVLDIEQDREGNIWFATMEGLDKFDGTGFTNYAQEEGLTSEILSSIHEDRLGNFWIGTLGGGINMVKPHSFEHLTTAHGLPDNKILAIEQDSLGNYWFGTLGGGLSKFDGEKFIHYTDRQGLRHNYVFALEADSKGNIWISNYPGGVSKFDGEKITVYGEKNGLSDKSVFSILEDSKGRLWFSTYNGGVTTFDGETFVHFNRNNGLMDNLVRTVFEDSKGNIWLGSASGVTRYDGNEFMHYTEQQGLSHHHVGSITEDHEGNIWFGTRGGGAVCFDGTRFICFTEKTGLSNNLVRSIKEDRNNRIWITTDNGINLIEKQPDDTYSILTFERESGLKGTDFFSNSALIDDENMAWWGSGKSLTKLDLDQFKPVSQQPEVYLTQLTINEKLIDFRNPDPELVKNLKYQTSAPFCNYPIDLELEHNSNHLTFYFSAVDWSDPHKVRYSYKLKGLNDQWSEITTNAFADYRSLPYGEYTFVVAAIGADNTWGRSFEYTFKIMPPWWHTWWARVIYVVVAAFLLTRIVQWRTYRLKKRHEELEMKIEQATGELRHQKMLVEQKNKSITDSITYAKRIQEAILPPLRIVQKALKESFIIYKPKDIVAGDFYWMETISDPDDPTQNLIIFAVADCTGHGVPGAMVSVLCSNALNRAVLQFDLKKPAHILDKTREIIISHFERSEDEVKDGMDIALCVYNPKTKVLQYSGAQCALWIVTSRTIDLDGIAKPLTIRNNPAYSAEDSPYKLYTIAPDRQPIGNYEAPTPFTNHTIQLEKGDTIYLFSDGFADQFGGPKGKKFKYKPLKEMLLSIQDEPMDKQRKIIKDRFYDWLGGLEQIDDVCAIGMRVHND